MLDWSTSYQQQYSSGGILWLLFMKGATRKQHRRHTPMFIMGFLGRSYQQKETAKATLPTELLPAAFSTRKLLVSL